MGLGVTMLLHTLFYTCVDTATFILVPLLGSRLLLLADSAIAGPRPFWASVVILHMEM
jgi:hypothetical protein